MNTIDYELRGYDLNFVHKGQFVHINSSTLNEDSVERIYNEFGLRVFYSMDNDTVLYNPDEWAVCITYLRYTGTSEKPSQPIGLKHIGTLFSSEFNGTVLDLTDWDFSQITDIFRMFNKCKNLECVKLGNKKLNPSCNVSECFYRCYKLYDIQFGGPNTLPLLTFNYCNSLFHRFSTQDPKLLPQLIYTANTKLTSADAVKVIDSEDTKMYNTLSCLGYSTSIQLNDKIYLVNLALWCDEANDFLEQLCGFRVWIDRSPEVRAIIYKVDEWDVAPFGLMYIGTSERPTQPAGIIALRTLFSLWSGDLLDLSHWDFSDIVYISNMCDRCSNLKVLKINGASFSKDVRIKNLASGCDALECLDLDCCSYTINKGGNRIATNLPNLKELRLAGWDANRLHKYQMLSDINSNYLGLYTKSNIVQLVEQANQRVIITQGLQDMQSGFRSDFNE